MQKRSVANLRAFQFFFHSAATIVISFLPLYFKNEGLTGTEIGWLLAIGPFVSLLVQPVSGYMSDKYQTVKRVLIVCLVGLILSSTVLFQMNSFAALMLAGGVFFCFMSPIGALGDSLAQKTADQKKIPFGSIRTWGSIGFSTTALITGQVLSVIGVGNIIFPYLFYAGAAFLLSFFISDVKVSQQPVKFAEAGKLLKNHKLVLFLFFMMFITVTHRANDSFIAIYITQLGGDESLVGVAWFAGVASEAAMFAFSTLWFRRFHELTFMFVAGFLYGTRWLIYSFINDPMTLIGFQVLHGICFAIFYLSGFQYVTRIIPRHLQSTGHLLFVSVFFGLSGILGSLLGGIVMDHAGGHTLYHLMSYFAFAGSAAFIVYRLISKKMAQNARVSHHLS